MHVYRNRSSFLSLQKCILPKEYYQNIQEESGNSFAFITVHKTFRVVSKLQIWNEPPVSNCCCLDFSVIQPNVPWESFDFELKEANISCLTQESFHLAENCNIVPFIEVIVIVDNVKALEKCKRLASKLPKIVSDQLKLFSICRNSVIFLDNVPETISFGIFCIAIDNLSGKKNSVYTLTDKTVISIKSIISLPLLRQKQSMLRNVIWDKLFFSSESTMTTLQTIARRTQHIFNLALCSNQLASLCEKNLLLVGTHGCGKTSIVEAIARHNGFIILQVNCGDFNLRNINSAKKSLEATFSNASLHAKLGESCVIFLKDIDSITRKKGDGITRSSEILVNKLCQRLEGLRDTSGIVVISTSNSPEDLSSKLRKYGAFSNELEIPMLSEEDREFVLQTISERFQVPCDGEVTKTVAKWTPGFVLADLMTVVKEARCFLQKEQDHVTTQLKCYKKAVSITTATAMKGTRGLVTSCKTNFSDIGGLENVKKQLRMSVQWPLTEPAAFARMGIPPVKGILLYGPPGCAKTMLVKALACETNTTFLAVSSADLYSPYVGESEKRLVKLFTHARIAAPAIIFIDEIDALVGMKDGGRERGVQERILSTLLVEMDGVGRRVATTGTESFQKIAEGESTQRSSPSAPSSYYQVDNSGIIVVGATNRPELIDDALKRPGRFDKLIYVSPPNANERLAILKTVTSTMNVDSSVDLISIADRTAQFSGADLKSLCTESALYALTLRGMDAEFVAASDFDEVLKTFKSSLSLEMINSYN